MAAACWPDAGYELDDALLDQFLQWFDPQRRMARRQCVLDVTYRSQQLETSLVRNR
jgi:hypothetical protein